MISIPAPTLRSMHLHDSNTDAALAQRTAAAEKLRQEVEDAEDRIAVDQALSSLGLKRVFSNSPTTMEIAAHERTGDRGSTFMGADMRDKIAKLDDAMLRLRLAELTIAGLRLLKTKRAELDAAEVRTEQRMVA